ncbi:hypothetical protein PDE_06946 [Penicillium oxalicum 114-2]|uniref:Uncharacterized protein n=1 Tax=Penicillium oxalicum (strain 114-2 / CGMCC 5302) TaxID=933388 RepID=S8BAW9_PENO1|nr:hypothetical protein PDE_06946 [Penicillium oxalicum 114-2]
MAKGVWRFVDRFNQASQLGINVGKKASQRERKQKKSATILTLEKKECEIDR